ncbi:MAG TPA: SAM-dependent methyltransferase [Actinomycetota bacterium]|nr:SAM-dependent methyltransferase [Actinomycetota bacterium]
MKARVAGSLIDDLRERVAATGPLTFLDFMELALYHPRHGYYASRVPGFGSDYCTSPSITPLFGRLVGRELCWMWEALGHPVPFWVIEAGAGLGDLAAAALEDAGAETGAIRWRFVERFERVRGWQAHRLGGLAEVAEWSPSLAGERPVAGCVLANEVLDNFPAHLLVVGPGGEPQEVYLDLDGSHLVEQFGPVSSRSLEAPAREAGAQLPEGSRFELCPALGPWLDEAARALECGYVLLIDYGDVEPSLWLEHPAGTIATHGPVDLSRSVLEDPGAKDVTIGVNFSAVGRAAASAGFTDQSLCSQQAWLLSLGLARLAEELELAGFQAALCGWLQDAAAHQAQLNTLLGLADPEGLGSIFVFRAAKDAPAPHAVRGAWAPG